MSTIHNEQDTGQTDYSYAKPIPSGSLAGNITVTHKIFLAGHLLGRRESEKEHSFPLTLSPQRPNFSI